ncbi:MAG TPA: M48 family metallopeptidase [Actinomycetota bacterium]|nr:M48 family metallopeptidase [Actinomycetota bacterium]
MYEQIASNKRRTVLLVLFMIVLFAAVGWALAILLGGYGYVGLIVAFVIMLFVSFASYRWGDKVVLASARAKEVTPDEQPRLHNIVEGMAIASGMPKPRVYVVPENAPNAFATGRDPEHSHIAVTQGLLGMMNRVELEGVVAHEMSHIVDRDILLGTIVATLVGAVVLIAEFMLRWFWWGGFGGRRGDDKGGGAAGAVFAIVGVALLVLAPLFAQIVKFAVSRRREYLADAEGAMLTRYPPGLASALKKIAVSPHGMRSANNATAHLWLDQPSRIQGEQMGFMEKLFSTHPPIQDRIRILEEM